MYKFFKRLLDITVSLVTLIILLPVFIPIIIILKFSAEGEVFYFQERYGIYNSKFQIWKFATMLKNSMNIGTGSITLQNDPRVTKIGSFLRRTKINELPQIINILKGDISLVGPRPDLLQLSDYTLLQTRRFEVMPGMTGLWQVSGKNRLSFDQMIDLNLQYIAQCSLRTDLMILLKTVIVLINQHNE